MAKERSQSTGMKKTRSKACSTTGQNKTSSTRSKTTSTKSKVSRTNNSSLNQSTKSKSSTKTSKQSTDTSVKTQSALKKNLKTTTSKKQTEKRSEIKYTNSRDEKLFPHSTFPYRLEDRKENKVCWFQCIEHATKYIERYKLQPVKDYKLQHKV